MHDCRRKVLTAWQERKQDEINHPFLDEKTTIGFLPHLQARLLARHLRADLDCLPGISGAMKGSEIGDRGARCDEETQNLSALSPIRRRWNSSEEKEVAAELLALEQETLHQEDLQRLGRSL
jgi:hypothetical protein